MRLCELREKEVINICDGEKLGNVCDIDFDLNDLLFCGRVFILLSKKRMFLHQKWLERWKKDEMSILWRRRYQGDRFKTC